MQLTQQIRVFPDEPQEELLWEISDICRKLYNDLLYERIQCWENDYDLTWVEQQNRLPKLKKKNSKLKLVYSKVLQMVVRQVEKDFRSFLALHRKNENCSYPRFKGKKYFTTMVFNQSGFEVENGCIEFSKPKMKFKIPERFCFEQIFQVTLSMKDNKFFASIVYEKKAKLYKDNGKHQAIDLGITNIVTGVNTSGKFLQISALTNTGSQRFSSCKAGETTVRKEATAGYVTQKQSTG
jgi:putative transposase